MRIGEIERQLRRHLIARAKRQPVAVVVRQQRHAHVVGDRRLLVADAAAQLHFLAHHVFSAEREQPAVLVLERQGGRQPGRLTRRDVPIRLQFVHSTVASPVHCGVKRWRKPTLTISGKLIVVFDGERCARRGYCERTVDLLVDAGTVANADGRRRRRRQSDAGGKAVAPIVARQFRKRPDGTGRGDAMAEVGLGILNLHADADADHVVDAPGEARRGVIGLQVAAVRPHIRTGP